MGLIRAAVESAKTTLADQWKEYFYCDAIDVDTLVVRGQKRTGSHSSNYKGNDNVISNGSGIAVADGQCMLIVESGQIVEVCAEPGVFTYDTSSEPSIFYGSLGKNILDSFKLFGKRFTYGGDVGNDQRVYYINTKEILDNKFGTPNPFMFDVVNKKVGYARTVQVRCNGIYSYRITDPVVFYKNVCGNVEFSYERDQIDGQLKTEFIDSLAPAFATLSELELRPSQIPAHNQDLKKAMNETLKTEWLEKRGITIEKIAMNPITLTPEDMKKINEMEDAASLGTNASMMAGRMTDATASAMEKAAENPNGAMMGFMGMNMVGQAGNSGFGAAQNLFAAGQQQNAAKQEQQKEASKANEWTCECGEKNSGNFCMNCGKPKPTGWTCECGTVNTGNFCMNCGKPKPVAKAKYRCSKCGWEPEDPENPPKFCPQCGDPFNEDDKE